MVAGPANCGTVVVAQQSRQSVPVVLGPESNNTVFRRVNAAMGWQNGVAARCNAQLNKKSLDTPSPPPSREPGITLLSRRNVTRERSSDLTGCIPETG